MISATIVKNNLRESKRQCYAVDAAQSSQFTEQLGCEACFCEPRCVPKRKKTRRYERKPGKKEAEEKLGEETRWRTVEGKGTNAVGGSWRRNDYRPRTHSLPAIISSTNATKSIESRLRKSRARIPGSIFIPSTFLRTQ